MGSEVDERSKGFREGLEAAAQYLRDCGDYGLNNIADHILTFEPKVSSGLKGESRADARGYSDAVVDLSVAVVEYQRLHDLKGDDHIETGRAWDRMRRANNKVRDLWQQPPAPPSPGEAGPSPIDQQQTIEESIDGR